MPHEGNASLNELQIIQNPALGAFLIWKFGLGFQTDSSRAPHIALAFLVLPLLLHKATREVVVSTNKSSGLSLFAAKLGKEQENILAIQYRALLLRNLTLQSIGAAARCQLVTINYEEGTIRANSLLSKAKNPTIPERLKSFPGAAEKLGVWFSGMGIHQIASTLKVDF